MARDSVSISIEPAVTSPKQPIKAGQAEDGIERLCPPHPPRNIEIRVRTRGQFSCAGQYLNVIQQSLRGNFQAAIGESGLQTLYCETPRFNNFFQR
jgi:hypothetical protein